MTRDELLDRIATLAKEAQESDHLPAAGVLFGLAGAVADGTDMELFELCVPHSAAIVERHTGRVDWSEDTLKV